MNTTTPAKRIVSGFTVPSYDGMQWHEAAAASVRFIGTEKITSTEHVLAVLNANPSTSRSSGRAFFESGSNASLLTGLVNAGWDVTWMEAGYYYVVESPTGDFLTYIEGDVYDGHGGKVCPVCHPDESTVTDLCGFHDWNGPDAVKPAA